MERTYIDYFRDEMRLLPDSGKEYDVSILFFPDIIQLLCDILDDDELDSNARVRICAALGYLVVPNDVVPEDIYGPLGYMDDMYLSCVVLNILKDKYHDIMLKLWRNDEAFDGVLNLCTLKSEKYLEEKNLKEKVLRFCGFAD